MSVDEIIRLAGGARAIEEASKGEIKRAAVYKWPVIGIPERNWPVIIEVTGLSAQELYEANIAARSDVQAS